MLIKLVMHVLSGLTPYVCIECVCVCVCACVCVCILFCVVMVLIKLVINLLSITPVLAPCACVDLNFYNTKHIGFVLHCMCECIDNCCGVNSISCVFLEF